MMTKFLYFISFCFIVSCDRSPDILNNHNLLKQHFWYLSETHSIQYNNDNNNIIKDTTVFSDACELNSSIRFLNDANCYKYVVCGVATPQEKQGEWRLTNDSLLTANIMVQISYGTGVVNQNVGINEGKLIELNNEYFKVKRIERWVAGSPGSMTNYRDEITATYRKK